MIRLQPSRLRDYLVCPLQYRLKYVDRHNTGPFEQTPALAFGISLHRALAEFHQPAADPLRHASRSPESLLARHWQRRGYASLDQEAAHFGLGVHVLERYMASPSHHAGHVVGTEVFLERVVVSAGQRVELACRVDRLTVLHDQRLEILDYKTNQDGQALDRDGLARDLGAFIGFVLARVMFAQFPRVVVAQLNLLSLNKTTVEYNDDERADNKARLLAVAEALEQQAFTPQLGGHCAWCRVRRHCPAYSAEAVLDEV